MAENNNPTRALNPNEPSEDERNAVTNVAAALARVLEVASRMHRYNILMHTCTQAKYWHACTNIQRWSKRRSAYEAAAFARMLQAASCMYKYTHKRIHVICTQAHAQIMHTSTPTNSLSLFMRVFPFPTLKKGSVGGHFLMRERHKRAIAAVPY